MDFVLGLVKRFPFIVLIVAIGGVGFVFRDHLTGAASDLRVGDCIDLPAEMTEVADVQHRPCGDPHDAEVFHVIDFPPVSDGGPSRFPTETQMNAFLDEQCTPAFEAYTGLDYDAATHLAWGAFMPVAAGWADGDRAVSCHLGRIDGAKLSGSLRASP